MMTTQEFNFLLAISEFGWSRAEYHWYYLWLYDSETNDAGESNLRAPLPRKPRLRAAQKSGGDQSFKESH
jgi:hypothetical protein